MITLPPTCIPCLIAFNSLFVIVLITLGSAAAFSISLLAHTGVNVDGSIGCGSIISGISGFLTCTAGGISGKLTSAGGMVCHAAQKGKPPGSLPGGGVVVVVQMVWRLSQFQNYQTVETYLVEHWVVE